MTDWEERLIRRLVFEPNSLSRNQNLHLFEDPVAARARRAARLIRALLADLKRLGIEAASIELGARAADGVEITIEDEEAGARRRTKLSREEWRILRDADSRLPQLGDLDSRAPSDSSADAHG